MTFRCWERLQAGVYPLVPAERWGGRAADVAHSPVSRASAISTPRAPEGGMLFERDFAARRGIAPVVAGGRGRAPPRGWSFAHGVADRPRLRLRLRRTLSCHYLTGMALWRGNARDFRRQHTHGYRPICGDSGTLRKRQPSVLKISRRGNRLHLVLKRRYPIVNAPSLAPLRRT